MSLRALGCALVAAVAACSTTAAPRSAVRGEAHGSTGARTATAPGAGGNGSAHRAWRREGFARPESVLYDEFHDRYLVSNSNGAQPGYISSVDPSGALLAARFIDGDRPGVSLRDPHGSAILDGRLYVADLATVRIFYLDDGRPVGDIEIPTATLLNDVVADRVGGRVYVSDSAVLRAADGSLTPNGNDAVYVLDKGVARPFARGRALANPNGLALDSAGALWVADGNGRLYRLAADGGMHDIARGPGKSLDGLVAIGERLLVSDWGTRAVWERGGDGRFTVVVGNVETPADIGWDGKRHRLLIPCIAPGALEAWDL